MSAVENIYDREGRGEKASKREKVRYVDPARQILSI